MADGRTGDPGRRGLLTAGAALGMGAATAAPGEARAASPTDRNASDAMRQPLPPPTPFPKARAPLPGAALEYWDTGGDGQVIVLLHPGTGSHAMWGYQEQVFPHAGYRVIAYSRRGYLGSDAGPENDPGSASDDLERLMDHLRIDRFHAVGSAAGAIVATDFAISRSNRLRSLTLACTIMGLRDPEYVALSNSLRPRGFAEMPAPFREVGPSYRAANPEGTARWLELEHLALSGRRVNQRVTNEITWAALRALRVPTLLLGGDSDLWAPPSIYRMYAEAIPNSELVILSEAGHAAHWEQPRAFNAAVLDFIGRHAG
ncbi:alpha/beta fold hydrolase [Muricoccus radiodurans]|uniref:alpha/beta fold hydrolase n=1 Tax=Muricoccus radiodurans TaxID=2231721 RepID=UPI003CEC7615